MPSRGGLCLSVSYSPCRDGFRNPVDFVEESVVLAQIVDVVDSGAVPHTWSWSLSEPREVTLVAWAVEPRAGGSRISLRHDGWDEAGLDAGVRDDHASYWAGYLEDLRDVLEEA